MKILIVSPAWIGDAVMAQSLYKILKHDIPKCRIEVLAPSWTLSVLKRMNEVDDTILSPFNHGELRLKERFSLAQKIDSKYKVFIFDEGKIFFSTSSLAIN